MFFQPEPPAPPEIVRTESDYLRIARKDVPLLLTREKQSEKAVIRYQLFVRTDVEARQDATQPDKPPPPIHCQWAATLYLEREPCFETLTGKLACAERYTVRLPDREDGRETLPLTAEATACAVAKADVQASAGRLAAAASATADDRFGDDLTRRLMPEYAKGGVKAVIRTAR